MKRFTQLFTTVTVMLMCMTWCACEKNGSISGYDKDMLHIDTYSNETQVKGGFSFTADQAWSTAIDYGTTVRSNEGWITLDPPSGNAGKVTINIILEENTTGEDRSATIRIICGETTLTIEIVQQAGENPNGGDNGGDNGDDNGDDNGGDEPSIKVPEYAIGRIAQTIEESGTSYTITYTFMRDEDMPDGTITRVIMDGVPINDESASTNYGTIEYAIERGWDKLYITSYANGVEYETVEANYDGYYVNSITFTDEIEMVPSAGTEADVISGIEKETYYFNRKEGYNYLYSTEYVSEIIMEDEQYNKTSNTTYNLVWERCNEDVAHGLFNNPYNMTQLNWEEGGYRENIERFTYDPNITYRNVMRIKRDVPPGSIIDLNHMVSLLWLSGPLKAYGECNGILGMLGWITPPSNNMLSSISYRYGESNGSTLNVTYELNDNNMIEKIIASGGDSQFTFEIQYTKF